jgi:hypothetical protein
MECDRVVGELHDLMEGEVRATGVKIINESEITVTGKTQVDFTEI